MGLKVEECLKKADECSAAAHYASDHDIKRTWRQLSDMWMLWAEHVRSTAAAKSEIEQTSPATLNGKAGLDPLVASPPISEALPAMDGEIRELADKLRLRLTLLPLDTDSTPLAATAQSIRAN